MVEAKERPLWHSVMATIWTFQRYRDRDTWGPECRITTTCYIASLTVDNRGTKHESHEARLENGERYDSYSWRPFDCFRRYWRHNQSTGTHAWDHRQLHLGTKKLKSHYTEHGLNQECPCMQNENDTFSRSDLRYPFLERSKMKWQRVAWYVTATFLLLHTWFSSMSPGDKHFRDCAVWIPFISSAGQVSSKISKFPNFHGLKPITRTSGGMVPHSGVHNPL